jgi:hypothetical protein
VRALPPSFGAVQVTVAEPLPAVAETAVGAPGTVVPMGVTAADGADAEPVPTALVADTVNVYVVPLASPETVAVVAGGLPLTAVGGWAVEPTNGVIV